MARLIVSFSAIMRKALGYVKTARAFAFVASLNRAGPNISGSALHNGIS